MKYLIYTAVLVAVLFLSSQTVGTSSRVMLHPSLGEECTEITTTYLCGLKTREYVFTK